MEPEKVYQLINEMRKELKNDFEQLEDKSDKIFVKIDAFDPVRKLVYGLVGIVLTGVMVAILGLVVVK